MNEYDVKEKSERTFLVLQPSSSGWSKDWESLMMCVFIQVAVPGLRKTYASRSWWCAASCLCRSERWRRPMPKLRTQVGLQGCAALVLICHWGLLLIIIIAQSSYRDIRICSFHHAQACTHTLEMSRFILLCTSLSPLGAAPWGIGFAFPERG